MAVAAGSDAQINPENVSTPARAKLYSRGMTKRDHMFPFQDGTPAPAGQTMQAREHTVTGVIADKEIGNPSNIASALFRG